MQKRLGLSAAHAYGVTTADTDQRQQECVLQHQIDEVFKAICQLPEKITNRYFLNENAT